MSVPKKKRTPASAGRRRSHHALKSTVLVNCEKCGAQIVPHQVCSTCGTYKGREVVNMEANTDTKKEIK